MKIFLIADGADLAFGLSIMGQIERLEIENFKSYGSRQTVGPFKRFTAVIGPNGAGKSNLMDAISFVLGVQSRHLRSTGLKELIFKVPGEPPQRRRAQVTLVYRVSADEVPGMEMGDELVFSRMISPTGVGSYRLNGRDVTWEKYEAQLKDIRILVKARNFLVFQGDVESIASKKPEELTRFLEQISGSEEMKEEYERLLVEKEQAENATVDSFQKKKQLTNEKRAVKEQKEEAERFRTKLQQLADMKAEHFLWQLFHIEEDFKAHEEQYEEVVGRMDKLSGREKGISDQFQIKKREHAKKLRAVGELEKQTAELKRSMEEDEGPSIKIKEAIKHCRQQIQAGNQSLERILTDRDSQQEEIEAIESDLQRIREEEESITPAAGLGMQMEESQRDEYHRIKEQARSQTANLRVELDTITRQQTADSERLQTLKGEETDLLTKKEDWLKQEKELVERRQKVSDAVKSSESSIVSLTKERAEVQEQHGKLVDRKTVLKAKLGDLQQGLRDAKDDRRQSKQEQRMSEIHDALKRLFPGVRGRLVDLCKPTQRKYNMAVTVATGKHMDAFVVNDQKTAMDCIQYLRDQRLGSASFLPLSSLRTKPINERLRNLSNKIKLAYDVIDCDPEIKTAVLYAVSNTVVCETLDDARELCFTRGESVKAVTLSGAVISKSGTMTGGTTSRDAERANRWDEKEVNEAKKRRDELLSELAEVEKALLSGSKSRLQELTNKIQGFENRLRFAKADLEMTAGNLENIAVQLEVVETKLREIRPQKEQIIAALSSRDSKVASLQQKVNKMEDKLYAKFSAKIGVASIREYEENALRVQEEQANIRRQLKEQFAKLEAKAEYLKSRDLTEKLKKLEKKITSDKRQLTKLEKEANELAKGFERKSEEIHQVERKLESARKSAEEVEVEAKTLSKEKSKLSKEKNLLATELTAKEAQMERLRAKRHEVLQKARVDEAMIALPLADGGTTADVSDDMEVESADRGSQQDSMDIDEESEESAVRFSQPANRVLRRDAKTATKIDFSGLTRYIDVEDEAQYNEIHTKYQAEIAQLAAEIEQMQPDMKAPERYAEVQQRLKTTFESLDKVKEAASDASARFEEAKSTRTRRFMAAFNHVSTVIDNVYKDLTRSKKHQLGGTASLILENPEEPYLGGIKFNAMPPMKRFRDMDQLSGGEKTVAALALLFSIHSFHPSPFFVLDEVDAALDNINVNKVSNYIRERSADFQCIVISLKDSFYEKADGLVGICREKKENSSKTLTLDLSVYAD